MYRLPVRVLPQPLKLMTMVKSWESISLNRRIMDSWTIRAPSQRSIPLLLATRARIKPYLGGSITVDKSWDFMVILLRGRRDFCTTGGPSRRLMSLLLFLLFRVFLAAG